MMFRFGRALAVATVVPLIVGGCAGGDEALIDPGTPQPTVSEVEPGAEIKDQSPDPNLLAPTPEVPTIEPGIVVEPPEALNLSKYFEFTYQTARSVGLDPDAALRADGLLSDLSLPLIEQAKRENDTEECMADERECGFFSLILETPQCGDRLLCVKQTLGKAGLGMATGYSEVSVLRIDPASGAEVSLSELLGGRAEAFIQTVNESAERIRVAHDFDMEDNRPDYSESTMPSWLPLTDGIHVWYPKYEVAPGAYGVVEIIVEETDKGFQGRPVPPKPENLVSSYDEAYDYLCGVETQDLPRLTDRFAAAYPVSVVQTLMREIPDGNGWYLFDGYVNGVYGKGTREAVERLQTLSSAQVDGLVGPETWNVLQYQACWHEEASQPADSGYTNEYETAVDLVVVPQVVGMFNKDAESVLGQAGLSSRIQAQIGDPSIAAQVNNDCVVTSQNPIAGSQVERWSTVTARMQCPNTGYNTP